jgi:RNA polymerase sigma-70 factor (ECF subfamily)
LDEIRKGNPEAFEGLIREHYKAIYSFMVYLTNNSNLAEDLTQEAFVSAYNNLDTYKGRASIKTWLHKIAYYKYVDSKRSSKREAALLKKMEEASGGMQTFESPLEKVMTDESSALLVEALRELEWRDSSVLVLHYIQDLSFRQMSKILKRPVGTVKWQTSRALKRLRQSLNGKAEL